MPKILSATENHRFQLSQILPTKGAPIWQHFPNAHFCQPSIFQSAKLLRFRSEHVFDALVMHCIRAGVPASTRTQRIGQF